LYFEIKDRVSVMKIRTGFDIAFESVQPTPMILALTVHP
jgi:hypothetical protein